MDDRCFSPDDLAAALDRADEPAARAHLAGCPACRSLFAAYRAFLAGGGTATKEATVAERDLVHRIAAVTNVEPATNWRTSVKAPRRRLLLVLASATTVLVAALILLVGDPLDTDPILLRGETTASAVTGLNAVGLVDGSVRLTWRNFPNASTYVVRLLSAELAELAVLDAVNDTTLLVTAATLAELAGDSGGFLLWDVAPLVRGDALARSAPQLVPRVR